MNAGPAERPSPIGQPRSRLDGRAKVTGEARYAAEFHQPGQACAVLVTAQIGLGRIEQLDAQQALAQPGVLAVVSHLNAPRLAYRPNKGIADPAVGERLHVLEDDRVRFYGQPVAVVVAATLEQAERAAAALAVRYTAQRPHVELAEAGADLLVPEAATRPGARIQADQARGDADAALAAAPVRIDATYTLAREHQQPIEPHATIASWSGDHLTLWSKSQYIVNERAEIAAIFGLEPQQVQILCPFVGGAFGSGLRTWPHVTLAALAARAVGRPVKLVLTRRQMSYAAGRRPAAMQRVALGATHAGSLTALIHEGIGETSRYEQFIEPMTSASGMLYSCPNVRTRYRIAPLDVSTPNHMRAPGEASGMFALECALDELAGALAIDPIELRLLNEPSIDEASGRPFSSRSLVRCFELGARRFGWARRDPRPRSMREGRLLVGWGTAATTYPALQGRCGARVRLLADGAAQVEIASSDMGPGTYTSIAQVAAEYLGLPPERVAVRLGQSDFPPAPPQGGSQTMASLGSAVRAACLALRTELDAGRRAREGAPLEATASAERDPQLAQRFSMHGFGAVFVEVLVDPDLASVRVRRALGVYGTGRIVNPKLARSQCLGGMIGGIGMALMERTVLDARDGRPVHAHLADYLIPVSLDIGALDALFVEEEDPHVNPLGVKGLGEITLVGVAPAIANAVYHATGRRVRELPIRIESLLGL